MLKLILTKNNKCWRFSHSKVVN